MDKSKNLYGHLFALTANVMWGLMSPIGKSALQEFSPISVTTFRMVGAAAAFWILSMFCKQEPCESSRYAENLLCFTVCASIQSRSVHLRAFYDFSY